jgi:lipopolysaccharide export system protein LptA
VVFEDLAVDRLVESDTLETVFAGGSDGLQKAHFAGNVRFRDGTTEAVSETAIYDVSAGMIKLQQAETSGRPARVVDTRSSVEAASIDLLMNGAGLKASGGVTSILTAPKNEGEEAASQAKMPGLVSSDDPVYVTSDDLLYDGKTGLALYTGHARLWQGETTVEANSIELDERTADLKASGAARSTFILEEINPATEELEAAITIASANNMHYEEEFRRTTYTDTAHINGPYGDLTAAKVEMYMGETRGSMDRAEAYETVKLLLNRRIATGGRLTYFTDSGRYVMHGTPVQILEDMITECRETLGQTLTFFRAIETITVDGNGEVRTQSIRTEMCPEPQFN